MSDSATEILNLIHLYAERMDLGDFDGAAALFEHAQIIVGDDGESLDSGDILEVWRGLVILYDDGTPRTKHVTTNPILEVDEERGVAQCRSYYTVFQQTATLSLQAIVAGRYHDRFERVDGKWRFSERDYRMMDLMGDVSHHLRNFDLEAGAGDDSAK